MLLQLFDFDVAIPDRGLGFAVEALEAERAVAAEILQGFRKFVRRAVGIFLRLLPVVEVVLIANLRPLLTIGVTVLIKGSRFMHMERVVNALTAETALA